ncbi:MAG: SDR family oxidoreductase [Leptolyngbyaceae cyanobacterium]
MKVLITGTEGYLGCLLAALLLRQGHDVTGIDTGFYKAGWLYNGVDLVPKTINKDIRHVTLEDLQGMDAVVHMAELSNDPTGQLAPHITHEINFKGSVRLAELAKQAGVTRFVYMSSCSVYGFSTEPEGASEASPVDPQTAYAKCKVMVERAIAPMADDDFSPTFMRNATAFGASPRMRFDIVINNLAGLAWTTKEIKMNSDGTPWRPMAHGLDIAKATLCALEAPRDIIHNQIFNVGDTSNNYRVKDMAEIIADVFTGCKLSFGSISADRRNYRVCFDKINTQLPGFKCEWDARRGVQQLHDLFTRIELTEEMFHFRGYTRLKQLEYLIRTQQIDQDFFWKPLSNGNIS